MADAAPARGAGGGRPAGAGAGGGDGAGAPGAGPARRAGGGADGGDPPERGFGFACEICFDDPPTEPVLTMCVAPLPACGAGGATPAPPRSVEPPPRHDPPTNTRRA
jgi:hypothetical protein